MSNPCNAVYLGIELMIAAVKLGQCLTQFLSVGAFNRDMLRHLAPQCLSSTEALLVTAIPRPWGS